jgi:hypothetical protein
MAPEDHAAGPTLLVRLRIEERTGADVRTIALRCQLRIEPQRRRYSSSEADRLVDVFGRPSQWASTVHPLQLASVTHLVPAFRGEIDTMVTVPCSFDIEVACGKYFASLETGEIPIAILFSGMAFLDGPGGFRSEPVPWHHEATHRLPVTVWRDMVDRQFPNQGWLRLRRDTIDELRAFAAAQAIVDTDVAVGRLLEEAGWPPR